MLYNEKTIKNCEIIFTNDTEEFKVAKLKVPNEEKGDGKMIDLFLGFALVSTDDGVTREIKRSRSKSA